MKKLSKQNLFDYFILVARVWLAWKLAYYGWGKLTGGQFGVTEATMNTPLKDVDIMRLSWFLADHEPFKSFIGISQVFTAILLLYNRTVILGAFVAIPIWVNILMWDMTFMGLYTPFTIIIPLYILLTILIIWHYRQKVLPALQNFVTGTTTKFNYPIWAYLLLPLLGIVLEFIVVIPSAIIALLKNTHR